MLRAEKISEVLKKSKSEGGGGSGMSTMRPGDKSESGDAESKRLQGELACA